MVHLPLTLTRSGRSVNSSLVIALKGSKSCNLRLVEETSRSTSPSVGGIKPSHYMGAYNISKAGLIYMTKQLAMELAPDIRVNGIAPAVVKTKLSEMLWAGNEEGSADLHALKKLGEPEDIASLIYFLSSDDASWITGEVVTIDGGFLL